MQAAVFLFISRVIGNSPSLWWNGSEMLSKAERGGPLGDVRLDLDSGAPDDGLQILSNFEISWNATVLVMAITSGTGPSSGTGITKPPGANASPGP